MLGWAAGLLRAGEEGGGSVQLARGHRLPGGNPLRRRRIRRPNKDAGRGKRFTSEEAGADWTSRTANGMSAEERGQPGRESARPCLGRARSRAWPLSRSRAPLFRSIGEQITRQAGGRAGRERETLRLPLGAEGDGRDPGLPLALRERDDRPGSQSQPLPWKGAGNHKGTPPLGESAVPSGPPPHPPAPSPGTQALPAGLCAAASVAGGGARPERGRSSPRPGPAACLAPAPAGQPSPRPAATRVFCRRTQAAPDAAPPGGL